MGGEAHSSVSVRAVCLGCEVGRGEYERQPRDQWRCVWSGLSCARIFQDQVQASRSVGNQLCISVHR